MHLQACLRRAWPTIDSVHIAQTWRQKYMCRSLGTLIGSDQKSTIVSPCEVHTRYTTKRHLSKTAEPEFPLRPYQLECINHSLGLMRSGVKRQAVSLPVGSGKTVVFSQLIPKIPKNGLRGTKTLVLAHRTELLEQACNKIRSANPKLKVAMEQGKQYADDDADVVVASVPTLGRKGSKRLARFDPDEFKCIIIDEAHHATASTYLRVIDYFRVRSEEPTGVKLWGCSATLQRHDGISLGAVFERVGYQRTIIDMWKEKWLCPARAIRIDTGIDSSSVSVSASTHDYVQQQLSSMVNTAHRNNVVVDAWKEHVKGGGRTTTLVFCVDVEHMHTLQAAFVAEGVLAVVVHGKTPTDERQDLLERFRCGEIPVLLNCGVFTEGTDIPRIDCVMLARPTRSSVLFQQMIGRGLRHFPGKKDCIMLDFNDNFGRNAALTVPSLLGLIPEFDANGEEVFETYQEMESMSQACPEVIYAVNIDDAKSRVKQHKLGLSGAGSPSPLVEDTEIRLKHYDDAHLPQSGKISGLNYIRMPNNDAWFALELPRDLHRRGQDIWNETGHSYLISLQHIGTVRIFRKSSDDMFYAMLIPVVGYDSDTPQLEDIIHIPMSAGDVEQAFAASSSYIQREFPVEYRQSTFGKWTKSSKEPATPKQLNLLERMLGTKRFIAMERSSKSGITKGLASSILDKMFSQKKSQKLKMKAAKGRAEKAATLLAGLVPKIDQNVSFGEDKDITQNM